MENYPNILGVRRYNLVTVVDGIPTALIDELGLLTPKASFDALDIDTCLEYQSQVAQRLRPITDGFWIDPRIKFMVVCGPSVFASRESFANFDHVGFGESVPYLPTVIVAPEAEPRLARVIKLF